MAWGVYFFAYNRAKDRYLHRAARTAPPGAPPLQRLSPAMHLISAAEAGALVRALHCSLSCVLCPLGSAYQPPWPAWVTICPTASAHMPHPHPRPCCPARSV